MADFFYGVRFSSDKERSVSIDVEGKRYKLRSVYCDYVFLYVNCWVGQGQLSPLHEWMVDQVIDFLPPLVPFIRYSRSDNIAVPDLLCGNISYEIETGFKHEIDPLIRRVASAPGFVYVVVPNIEVKKKYVKLLYQFHGRIFTLRNLSRSI